MADSRTYDEPRDDVAGCAARRAVTLLALTPSSEPCAVEIFSRQLADALGTTEAGSVEILAVTGRWRDVPRHLTRIAHADRIVFNLPLVAWKRTLAIPLVLLAFSFVIRRQIAVFMHEWAALHPLRRLVLAPFAMLADRIAVLSPYVRDQITSDFWIGWCARKCRLVPHPPTINRPDDMDRQLMSARVRKIASAAEQADIVIGHFGSLYAGKAPMALLDVCAHLRTHGIRALIVFVGSFIKSLDGHEDTFRVRVAELGLGDQVIITGYVDGEDELFALFSLIDVFLFLFPEGLTARRSSVIACLQSDRSVVVSAPHSPTEFAHHPGFTALIETGVLSFLPPAATTAMVADQLLAVAKRRAPVATAIDRDAWWSATKRATYDLFR